MKTIYKKAKIKANTTQQYARCDGHVGGRGERHASLCGLGRVTWQMVTRRVSDAATLICTASFSPYFLFLSLLLHFYNCLSSFQPPSPCPHLISQTLFLYMSNVTFSTINICSIIFLLFNSPFSVIFFLQPSLFHFFCTVVFSFF